MESAELLNYLWLILAGLVAGFINVAAGGGSLITLPVLIFLGSPPTRQMPQIVWESLHKVFSALRHSDPKVFRHGRMISIWELQLPRVPSSELEFLLTSPTTSLIG